MNKKLLSKLTLLFNHKYNENKLSSVFDGKHFFKINKKDYFHYVQLCNYIVNIVTICPSSLVNLPLEVFSLYTSFYRGYKISLNLVTLSRNLDQLFDFGIYLNCFILQSYLV